MHDEPMATDEGDFWARRREIVRGPDDRPEPDGGRRFVLLVDVTDAALCSRYERLRADLDGFDCLTPTPPERLHVTVKAFDFSFESAPTTAAADAAAVDRIDAAVAAAAADCEPFTVDFPRLNVFPDVVYAEIDGGDSLAGLNRRLCDAAGTRTLDRDAEQFIPHLTLGYYTGNEDCAELVSFLERNRELSLPPLRIDSIGLAAYGLTDDWHPDYELLETYDLAA
jgi:2'-5' RNA ligase